MKKPIVAILAVLALVFTAPHPSFAADSAREEVKRLAVMNAELLIKLVQSKIDNIDLMLDFLDYQLFVVDKLIDFGDRNFGKDERTKALASTSLVSLSAKISEARENRKKLLETLEQAKRGLEDAKSL